MHHPAWLPEKAAHVHLDGRIIGDERIEVDEQVHIGGGRLAETPAGRIGERLIQLEHRSMRGLADRLAERDEERVIGDRREAWALGHGRWHVSEA